MSTKQARVEKSDSSARLLSPMFLLVMLSTLAYFISVGALQPTLPRFVEGPLGGGDIEVGLAIGAFAFSAVLIRPLVGPLGDRKGRRLLIVLGAGIVSISVAGYVFAETLWLLLLLRLLSGVGEACFYVGAASVVNDLAPEERRGEAVSYFSLSLYLGLTVGPLIGETVFDASSYDAAWIVAAFSAGIAALLGLAVSDTRPEGPPSHAGFRWFHPAGIMPGTVLAASIWGLGGFATFIPLYALSLGMSGSRLVFASFSIVVLLVRSLGARLPDILGVGRAARHGVELAGDGVDDHGSLERGAGVVHGCDRVRTRPGTRLSRTHDDGDSLGSTDRTIRGSRYVHRFLRPVVWNRCGCTGRGRHCVRIRRCVPQRGCRCSRWTCVAGGARSSSRSVRCGRRGSDYLVRYPFALQGYLL